VTCKSCLKAAKRRQPIFDEGAEANPPPAIEKQILAARRKRKR
jgi:hypothetical protein